jgi:hypothetical protein
VIQMVPNDTLSWESNLSSITTPSEASTIAQISRRVLRS